MRKCTVGAMPIAAALATIAVPALSGEEIIGVRIGVNAAQVEGYWADIGVDDYRIGLNAGLTIDVPVTRGVTLQSGLFYSQKGSEGEIDASTLFPVPPGTATICIDVAFDSVDVPILLKAGGTSGGFVVGGLNIGIITAAELSMDLMGSTETMDIEDSTRDLDFSAVLGLGYTSRNGRFYVTAQYALGLEDVVTTSIEAKNRVLSFGIGFLM
ncbi:MAG: porin family protein [Planctomycetota bacterium]